MGINRVLGPIILLLAVASFLGGCGVGAATPTPIPATTSLILSSRVAAVSVTPGGDESIAVTLLDAGLPMDLSVNITYADGRQQLVEQHARDTNLTLRWKVPTTAATGTATFGLLANHGCECDIMSDPAQSRVQGSFVVADGHP